MTDLTPETRGVAIIAAERRRQVEVEGWTLEHDAEHGSSRLLRAAEAYESRDLSRWPWDAKWWKPKDALSNLVRAGALYQAASDITPEFDGAAKAGVRRCAAEIDAILGSPALAPIIAAAEARGRDTTRAAIATLCGDNAIYADFGEPPNEDVVPGVRESDLLAALDDPDATLAAHDQAIRERIAADIEATHPFDDCPACNYGAGLRDAARIARGGDQ